MELGQTRPSKPSSCDRKRRSTPKGLPARAPADGVWGGAQERRSACKHVQNSAQLHLCSPGCNLAATCCRCCYSRRRPFDCLPAPAPAPPEPRGRVPTRGMRSPRRMSSRCQAAAWLSSQWPQRTVCRGGGRGGTPGGGWGERSPAGGMHACTPQRATLPPNRVCSARWKVLAASACQNLRRLLVTDCPLPAAASRQLAATCAPLRAAGGCSQALARRPLPLRGRLPSQ
jgi:hypothetical protein